MNIPEQERLPIIGSNTMSRYDGQSNNFSFDVDWHQPPVSRMQSIDQDQVEESNLNMNSLFDNFCILATSPCGPLGIAEIVALALNDPLFGN